MAAGAGDARACLDKIAEEAAGLFGAGMASIFLLTNSGLLAHVSGFGVPPQFVRKFEESGGAGWVATVLHGDTGPIVIEAAQNEAPAGGISQWAASISIATLAFAPLKNGGKPLGLLVLYHQSPHKYSQEECDALQTLAGLTARVAVRAQPSSDDHESGASRTQLFSALSHELRTPLTSIMGYTQIIRKRMANPSAGSPDPRLIEQMDVLWAQAQRLNRLIDTFVDLARIERGEFEIVRGKVELTALLRSVVSQAIMQTGARHTVNLDIPERPSWLHGDNKRLEQVFHHIISNAVRYSPQHQLITITLQVHDQDKQVEVRVTDKGQGIPTARLKDLFERNYASGPLRAGGLGMGLYLSKVIVEAHGGNIAVDSATGQGTAVSIILPL